MKILTVVEDPNDLPVVQDFDKKQQNVVIFDDVITESMAKLKKIQDYWVFGRKYNITPIFLSQSYFRIPKLIRDNTDVLALRGVLGLRDLNLILSEMAADKKKEELLAMYNKCNATSTITDFFLIDRSVGQDPAYRFRHNWSPIDEE